jgi:hypothetical protein
LRKSGNAFTSTSRVEILPHLSEGDKDKELQETPEACSWQGAEEKGVKNQEAKESFRARI